MSDYGCKGGLVVADFNTVIQEQSLSPDDIPVLAADLEKIVGEEGVSVREIDRLANSRDFWPMASIWFMEGRYPAVPDVVVWPRNTEEVSAVLSLASEKGVPVTPYGEGSGTLGGAIALRGGIVLDMKKMNRVKKLDGENQMVTVETGLNGALYEEYLNRQGYTGGHFPQSLRCSSVGGWLACRAAGQYSGRYGKIEDMLVSLEAVLADGTVIRGRDVPRTATGPRVDHLFLGSEGTLGVITEATLTIWPYPEKRTMSSFSFETMDKALEAIRFMMRAGARPAVVRLYDYVETSYHFPETEKAEGRCMLVLLIEGNARIVEVEHEVCTSLAREHGGLDCGEQPVEHWLERRFNVSLASKMFRQGAVLDTIEVTSNWHNAFETYKEMQQAMIAVEGVALASGHYSHVYPEGACLYITTMGTPPDGDKTAFYKRLWDAAMDACLSRGAAISHHHGVGLHRGQWMEREHGAALDALRRIKKALDPQGIINPGKLGLEEAKKWPK